MKRVLCFLLVFITCYLAPGQKILPEFGKIDVTDIRLKSCPIDPDAGAMNLFKVQEIELKTTAMFQNLQLKKEFV